MGTRVFLQGRVKLRDQPPEPSPCSQSTFRSERPRWPTPALSPLSVPGAHCHQHSQGRRKFSHFLHQPPGDKASNELPKGMLTALFSRISLTGCVMDYMNDRPTSVEMNGGNQQKTTDTRGPEQLGLGVSHQQSEGSRSTITIVHIKDN